VSELSNKETEAEEGAAEKEGGRDTPGNQRNQTQHNCVLSQ